MTVTYPIRTQSIRSNLTGRLRVAHWVHAGCFIALSCGRAFAQEQQGPALDEVDISVERQNALENETLEISGTPDAGPHLTHTNIVLGIGALVHPVYIGSKKNEVSPFPYVDIRGLLGDRLYFSDAAGFGVKILNQGLVQAGVSFNHGGDRLSKDDPHLKGLPDIKATTVIGAYVVLGLKPVALEARVQQRTGSGAGTTASLAASYHFAPFPKLHLAFGPNIAWANAADQKVVYGITPADAAAATAQGNPLPAYTATAGLTTFTLVGAGVYQINRHWGVLGRVSFSDLIGSSARNSPLTQRSAELSSFGLAVAYMF